MSTATWRRNLYALWIAQTLTITGFSLRAPFLPFFLKDLGADSFASQALWAGIINAGGAAVMAVTAPIWGMIADRYGRKPMVLRAMFAGSVTVGLMGLATSPWHLLGLRFIEGAFTGTVTASTTLVASTAPKERMGFSLGMMQMAVFSGASIGPLLGGLIADQIGYRASFVVGGAMLFTGGVIVLTQVRESFTRPQKERDADRDGSSGPSLSMILLGGSMLSMIAVMFVLRTGSSAIQPIMPLYVEHLSHPGASLATLSGLTLGIAGVTSAIAAVTLGRLADRIGQRQILIVSAIAVGLLSFPQALAQSPMQLIVLQALFGIAAGGVMPTANAIVVELTPAQRRGAIFGFVAAATAMGGFVGPLGGSLVAASIDIRVVFVFTGALMLAAAAWVVSALRPVSVAPVSPATENEPPSVESPEQGA